MTIALDATYSVGDHLTGVGVYSRELLAGLAAAHPDETYRFCYRAHRFLRSFRDPLPPNARRSWLGSGGFWPRGSAPLFHGLNQRIDAVRAKRIVATFHDLFVVTGDYSTSDFRIRFTAQARQAAERAHRIIAVSQFTADQVVDVLGVERSRVSVIHHGTRPWSGEIRDDETRENLVLHVGAIQHRKNLLRLIEAFERTPEDWRLVLAGSQGYGAAEILDRIERSTRRSTIEVVGFVEDRQLDTLYARARVFAFPSLDEGFGMPILDAMARGVPVLTSNRSATREVAGASALLIDPTSVDTIASGLLRIVHNVALRNQLRRDGLMRAREFTWEKAAAQTWGVYQELL